MTTLQTRLAQADKPSRELLWEAWQDIMMPELCGDDENSQRSLYIHQCRYLQLLDAEAWTSAVMLMITKREDVTDMMNAAWGHLSKKYGLHCNHWPDGLALDAEYALALAIACLKARGL